MAYWNIKHLITFAIHVHGLLIRTIHMEYQKEIDNCLEM